MMKMYKKAASITLPLSICNDDLPDVDCQRSDYSYIDEYI